MPGGTQGKRGSEKTVLTGVGETGKGPQRSSWVRRSLGWCWPGATQEVVAIVITWAECIRWRIWVGAPA